MVQQMSADVSKNCFDIYSGIFVAMRHCVGCMNYYSIVSLGNPKRALISGVHRFF
jgi:hypothetical protein